MLTLVLLAERVSPTRTIQPTRSNFLLPSAHRFIALMWKVTGTSLPPHPYLKFEHGGLFILTKENFKF